MEKDGIIVQEVTCVGHVVRDSRQVQRRSGPRQKLHRQLTKRKFIGFIQYLAKFLPRLSQESAPLRHLLSKDVVWHWDGNKQKSFWKLKEMVTNTPVLTYFDPEKPVLLTVDSSSTGLGAALIQDGSNITMLRLGCNIQNWKYSDCS